uniref:WD40/YVTN/BNR-like repeat-containing protein n=1 Tax=Desertifilum tharense IPPAS B-1220 TaxID=1781255 RepID=A0ACD5GWJ2_9CYAN
MDGFVHDRGLEQFPSHKFGKSSTEFQGTYGLAYAYNQPSNLVRVGGNQWNNEYSGATSRDSGKSWQKFATFPPETMPLRVAMSATNPNLFVVTTSGKPPIRTADSGRTWTTVKGLPDGSGEPWNWLQSLAADGTDGQTFYYYYNNTVFRSTDGGATFSPASEINGRNLWHVLETIPGEKGEVWLGLDDRGLHRSTNGGESFRKIETVERAHLVSFGKPRPGSNTPALYIYGRVTGQGDGIFRSLDKGQTWTRIGDRDRPIGRIPNTLEASWQEYDLVFIGTNGTRHLLRFNALTQLVSSVRC